MSYSEREYVVRARAKGVPEHLIVGLVLYLTSGCSPGHFLTAVLENNLMEAMARADIDSRRGLFEICSFLYNYAPAAAWGSPEKVREWQAERLRNRANEISGGI